MDGDGLFLHHLLLGGDEQHVVGLQWDVGHAAAEDAVHVDGHHLQCAVGLHAVHHGMGGKGFFLQSLGGLKQGAHAVYLSAHLVHARAEHGTFQLHHVREA